MNVKIQKAPFQSNLSGVQLFAFAVLESKLVSGIGQAIGRSTWELACNSVATLTAGMDVAKASAAIEKYKSDAIKALESREVNAAIEAAGLGDVASISRDKDGKQDGLGKDGKHLARLYGEKFRLGPQIDRATTTIKQYCDNLRASVELSGKIDERVTELKAIKERTADEARELDALNNLDVSYKGKTVQQVVRANRDASEAFSPAKLEARKERETAARVGRSFTDFYSKADDECREMIHAFNVILDGWMYATPQEKAEASASVMEQGPIFDDAKARHAAAEAAENVEGQSASELPEVPETSDESIHAADTHGTAEPQAKAA